uniref:HNH endonuclease n=1 Tax=Haematomicrobium sanguinis TaxID=479106 RepID=UPI000552D3B2
AFCEAHHITPWSHGGHTNLNNGALLCPYHHHYIHTGTWTLTITNNTPTLTPPPWIDPHQQPQTNTIHTLRIQ